MTAFSPIASLMAALNTQLAAPPAPATSEASVGFLELFTDAEVAAEEDLDAPVTQGKEDRREESDAAATAWAAVLPVVTAGPVEREAPPLSLDVAVAGGDEVGEAMLAPASSDRSWPADIRFEAGWTPSCPEVTAPLVAAPARVVGQVEAPADKAPYVSRVPGAPAPYKSAGADIEELRTPAGVGGNDGGAVAANASVPVRRPPGETDPRPAPERSVVDPEPAPSHPDPEELRRPAETAPELRLIEEPPSQEARRAEVPTTRGRPGGVERVEKGAVNGERHLDAERRNDDGEVVQRQQPPVSVAPMDAAPAPNTPHSAAREPLQESPVERRPAATPLPSRIAPPRKMAAPAAGRPVEPEPKSVSGRPHLAFGARLTPAKERAEHAEPTAPAQRPEAAAAAPPSPSWTAGPNERDVPAERPETALVSEGPKTQEAKAVTPPVARDIRLEVGEPDRKVEVRLVERAGEVRVAVRTPDDRLAEGLREQLPSLSSRLEQTGFRADEWKAAAAGGAERRLDVDAPDATADHARQQSQPQDRGQERRDSEPRPHGDPEQESRRQKEKGNAFAWLMESLR